MKKLTTLLLIGLISQNLWAAFPGDAGRSNRGDKLTDAPVASPRTGRSINAQAIELNILLDVSGSMRAELAELACQTIESLLANLRRHDTFTIRTFAGSSDSLADNPLLGECGRHGWVRTWLRSRHASGGIELPGAVRSILTTPAAERQRVIAIITDGRLWGAEQAFGIIRHNAPTTTVIACNIGPRSSLQLQTSVAGCKNGIGLHIRHSSDIAERLAALWDTGTPLLSINSSDNHFTTQTVQGGLQ